MLLKENKYAMSEWEETKKETTAIIKKRKLL